MSIKLSIIIPVFNDEKHIERCLKSVFDQDIGVDEYEVIVVNDGSYDSTQSIVEGIQERHQNLFLINTKNGKSGAARNAGMKHSKGKYILFIDSDDYIKCNVLSGLINEMDFYDLDVLLADYYKQENSSGKLTKNTSYLKSNLSVQSGIEFIKKNEIYWVAWLCMYKKSLFIENNIEYREGVFFEDVDICIKSVFFAKAIKYLPIFFYVHTYNINSITNGKRTIKKLRDQIDAAISLQEFVKEKKVIDVVVYSILIRHVVLKFIEPLKTSIFLSFKDRFDVCMAIKHSLINKEIDFEKNRLIFIIFYLINLSPLFSAAAITSLSPLIKFSRLLKSLR